MERTVPTRSMAYAMVKDGLFPAPSTSTHAQYILLGDVINGVTAAGRLEVVVIDAYRGLGDEISASGFARPGCDLVHFHAQPMALASAAN